MKMIKRNFVIILMLLFTSLLFARQISFQVVQKDAAAQNVTEKSLSIEDELLLGFFSKGFIVTNSQAVSSKTEELDQELWDKGFGDAFDGFSDFFVQVKVYFSEPRKNKNGKTVKDIKRAGYIVTAVQSGKTIEDSYIDYDGFEEDVRKVSADLINRINMVIKAKA